MPSLDEAELARRLALLPARMSQVIQPWVTHTPRAIALVEQERVLTYQALGAVLAATGTWLREQGIRPGDRAMVVGENSIALAVLVLAIGEIDAWPVVVNARLSPREIDDIRVHAGARRVFYTSAVSPEACAHARRAGATGVDLAGVGPLAVGPLDDAVSPEAVHAEGSRQVGALLYTSGTTGTPKGVMLSHRSVLFTSLVGGLLRGLGPGDRIHGVLPMSHIVGFSTVLVGMLMFGASVDLVPRFDPAATLAALARRGITRLQGVPTMFQRLLDHAAGRPIERPHLRYIGVAGAPLDRSLKEAVERAFGTTMHNGYGITECAPTIACTLIESPRADESVGPPIPGIEVRRVPEEDVGELQVRGPNVMLGYYRAPDLTAAVLDADGWFSTGDLARRAPDGSLFIVGRSKELIIRSGFNVHPPEVEAVLNTHPAVAVSAVVGRKVPGNEEVVAFVQLRAGVQATGDGILAYARERLAPYKRPVRVVVKPALPTSSAGKILKHLLAGEAAQAADGQ